MQPKQIFCQKIPEQDVAFPWGYQAKFKAQSRGHLLRMFARIFVTKTWPFLENIWPNSMPKVAAIYGGC